LPLIYKHTLATMISSYSISSSTLLACLSILAQPVLCQYSNTSMTITVPSPISTNATTPTVYSGWKLDGCFTSGEKFPDFNIVLSSTAMTYELCTNACTSYKYATLFEEFVIHTTHKISQLLIILGNCYCGNALDPIVLKPKTHSAATTVFETEPNPTTASRLSTKERSDVTSFLDTTFQCSSKLFLRLELSTRLSSQVSFPPIFPAYYTD
jgi:hypothetical protein